MIIVSEIDEIVQETCDKCNGIINMFVAGNKIAYDNMHEYAMINTKECDCYVAETKGPRTHVADEIRSKGNGSP